MHLLAFFILVYVGVEVTIGGWIVTFIIDVRGGGASSGYISAGFFGGLCLSLLFLFGNEPEYIFGVNILLKWVDRTDGGACRAALG